VHFVGSSYICISRCRFRNPKVYIVGEYHYFGAWGGVVVKPLVKSEGPGIDPWSLGIFSGASDSSMSPGVDSASKNEYQDIPGGKDGRCVRMTTLPPSCAECLEILEP